MSKTKSPQIIDRTYLLSHLCYYDTRNPKGIIDDLPREEVDEEGWSAKKKENCFCDNCFQGRTELAEVALSLFTEDDLKHMFECGRSYQNNAEITFKVSLDHLVKSKQL